MRAWAAARFGGWLGGLPGPTRSDWIFALRTVSAALIALVVAYALKLDHPQWAMMTVFIVSQPVAGMVLAKGFYRLAGTLAGAVAAMAIVALFGAAPWPFVAALALWIGACTFVSSLLRNPEAYGAALAGYTATIIALPAFGAQHAVTGIAAARCAEIAIGIVCAGLTSRLVLPQLAGEAMGARLRRCVTDLAAYASASFGGGDPARLETLYRKLVGDVAALGEMRAYARLEAPSQATRAHPVRRTIGHLLSALSAARMLRLHPAPQDDPAVAALREELRALVRELAESPLDDSGPWIARLTAIAQEARAGPVARQGADPAGTLSRLTVAGEFAEALREALRGLDALRGPPSRRERDRRQPALVIHRDRHGALRNAVRATLATALVAAFWLATRWSELEGTVIIIAVVSSLFAPRPDPVGVAWGFFKGTLLAFPFAFVVGQLVLPALPGFGWFTVFVSPILIPASLAMANPRMVGVATAFAINFLAFLSPHPVMAYDPAPLLAGAASILVGILLAIAVYLVVLPADPVAAAERIARAMRADLARLCLHARIPRRTAFESLAYDRLNQLMPLAKSAGRKGEALFGGAIAAVAVGLEIMRLRGIVAAGGLGGEAEAAVADSLALFARDLTVRGSGGRPRMTPDDLRARASALAAEGRGPALHAAAALRVVAAEIDEHPAFFRASS